MPLVAFCRERAGHEDRGEDGSCDGHVKLEANWDMIYYMGVRKNFFTLSKYETSFHHCKSLQPYTSFP